MVNSLTQPVLLDNAESESDSFKKTLTNSSSSKKLRVKGDSSKNIRRSISSKDVKSRILTENDILKSENSFLKEQLATIQSELELSRLQKNLLSAQTETLQLTNASKGDLEAKLADAKTEISSLRKDLAQSQAQVLTLMASPETRNQELKQKVKNLKLELKKYEQEGYQYQNQKLQLTNDLKTRSDELAVATKKCEKMKIKIDTLKQNQKCLDQQISEFNSKLGSTSTLLKHSELSIQQLKLEHTQQITELEIKLQAEIEQSQSRGAGQRTYKNPHFKSSSKGNLHLNHSSDGIEMPSLAIAAALHETTNGVGSPTLNRAHDSPLTSPVPHRPELLAKRDSSPTPQAIPSQSLSPRSVHQVQQQSQGPDKRLSAPPGRSRSTSQSPNPQRRTMPPTQVIIQTSQEKAPPALVEPDIGAILEETTQGGNDSEEEDDYAKAKREYEQLMKNAGMQQAIKETTPAQQASESNDIDSSSEEDGEMDDYQRMKAEYEKLQKAAAKVQISTPPVDPAEADYERIKAEYEQQARGLSEDIKKEERTGNRASTSGSGHVPKSPSKPLLPNLTSQVALSPGGATNPRLSARQNTVDGGMTARDGGATNRSEGPTPRRTATTNSRPLSTAERSGEPAPNPFANRTSSSRNKSKGSISSTVSSESGPPSVGRPLSVIHSPGESTPDLVALPVAGISGVTLVSADQGNQNLLEHLKSLALSGNMPTFGNNLKITIGAPQVVHNENLFLVHITTDMRQFGHVVFDQLDVYRSYSDFEALHKTLVTGGGFTLPKMPKKKTAPGDLVQPFQEIMNAIAMDPEINALSNVVDFFDNSKYASEKSGGGILGFIKNKIDR